MLLIFLTANLLHFRFTVIGQYWRPSWLFTLTFFRRLSEPVAPMPFMQQGIWILHTVSSSSVSQLRSA